MRWLLERLTCWYARFGFGKIDEISEYSWNGETRQVYWFSSDSRNAGHCTPFNTILLNRRRLEKYSDKVTDYVFVHEAGHADLHILAQLFLYIALIPSLLVAIAAPFAAVFQTVQILLLTQSLYYTLLSVVSGLITIVLFTLPFLVFSWISEGHAELVALKKLGREDFLQCHNEIQSKSEKGLFKRLIHLIQYPPPRVTIFCSEKIGNRF